MLLRRAQLRLALRAHAGSGSDLDHHEPPLRISSSHRTDSHVIDGPPYGEGVCTHRVNVDAGCARKQAVGA